MEEYKRQYKRQYEAENAGIELPWHSEVGKASDVFWLFPEGYAEVLAESRHNTVRAAMRRAIAARKTK